MTEKEFAEVNNSDDALPYGYIGEAFIDFEHPFPCTYYSPVL